MRRSTLWLALGLTASVSLTFARGAVRWFATPADGVAAAPPAERRSGHERRLVERRSGADRRQQRSALVERVGAAGERRSGRDRRLGADRRSGGDRRRAAATA